MRGSGALQIGLQTPVAATAPPHRRDLRAARAPAPARPPVYSRGANFRGPKVPGSFFYRRQGWRIARERRPAHGRRHGHATYVFIGSPFTPLPAVGGGGGEGAINGQPLTSPRRVFDRPVSATLSPKGRGSMACHAKHIRSGDPPRKSQSCALLLKLQRHLGICAMGLPTHRATKPRWRGRKRSLRGGSGDPPR